MTYPDDPPPELLERTLAILEPHRAQLQPLMEADAAAEAAELDALRDG